MADQLETFDDQIAGTRVVVTGGAGFVGSNLVARLVGKGASVVVLDDFYTGSERSLGSLDGEVEAVRGSVIDAEIVRNVLSGANVVIHAAARNIIVSTRNPREDYEVNIGGSLNVLLAAGELGVQRVVYTSSASVYGNPRYLPINEDDATNMLSPYAVSFRRRELLQSVFKAMACDGVRPLLERLRAGPEPREPVLRRHRKVL